MSQGKHARRCAPDAPVKIAEWDDAEWNEGVTYGYTDALAAVAEIGPDNAWLVMHECGRVTAARARSKKKARAAAERVLSGPCMACALHAFAEAIDSEGAKK